MERSVYEKLMYLGNHSSLFALHNHIRVVDVDDGRAAAELTLSQDSLNRWGAPHGGALFTLADTAAGMAALTVWQTTCVTLDCRMEYIAQAAPAGRLTAIGTVRRCGGHVCFCGSEITDGQGKLIARMEATFYNTGRALPEVKAE